MSLRGPEPERRARPGTARTFLAWSIKIAGRHVGRAMRATTEAETAADAVRYVDALAAVRCADAHLATAWRWIESERLIRHDAALLFLASGVERTLERVRREALRAWRRAKATP